MFRAVLSVLLIVAGPQPLVVSGFSRTLAADRRPGVVSCFSRTVSPFVVSGFSRTVSPFVVSGFSRTAAGFSPVAPPVDPLNVSAALSLGETLDQVGAAYARSGGAPIRLNLGASNALARQMVSGAPVDVFISADEAQMDVAERAGALAPGTRVALVGNQLAVVTTPQLASRITSPGMLADASVRRIAIGDPTAVPAGVYARQYLQRIGLWQNLSARLVPTTSVRAALSAVDSGAADAAIVYVTDAAVARSARVAFKISGPDAPRIVYPAAIGANARNKSEASRFLSFLRGADAAAIFRAHGFLPLAAR